MENSKTKSVGEFVANDYRTAAVFQKYGIDFCCKGNKTIEEVCESKKISAGELLAEINEVSKQAGVQKTDFQSWPLDRLADYIEKKHHRYIVETTPVLKQYLDKLCKVHGGNHPELFEINEEFNLSAGELAMHMKKEEMILFPFIRKMADADNNPENAGRPALGAIQNPINMMMQEHDIEGERFRKMALLSANYNPPADACNTYRVAYSLLNEFEDDLHLHIHLENNILFPKAIELEKALVS
ncbi:MAG: iron-sulfur cluster repair di-iron protein [Bacteroidia bacterium]